MPETLVFSSQGLTATLQDAISGSQLTYTRTDISFANADNSINTVAGNFITAGFVVGQEIVISGSVSNNFYGIISTVAALKIVLTAATTLVDEVAGATDTLSAVIGPWVAHLASAGPATPGFTDTVASYTESTETGYAPVTLAESNYVFTVLSPNAIATYMNFSFTFTVSFATVTHVFITDSTNKILIGGSKLGTPNVSGTAGGTINIDSLAFAIS